MRLTTPLTEATVRSLKVGDIVHLDGIIYTGRDEVHLRALEHLGEGKELPVDLRGAVLFHCGPIVVEQEGGWRLLAAGPTTSARMNSLEPGFIDAFGIRGIIGKGGMSAPTVRAMQEHGCVYLAITGGAAVLAARGIRRVVGVEWLDLGVPEAMWILEFENLGPLTVAIDAHGRSLYEGIAKRAEERVPEIRKRLGL